MGWGMIGEGRRSMGKRFLLFTRIWHLLRHRNEQGSEIPTKYEVQENEERDDKESFCFAWIVLFVFL